MRISATALPDFHAVASSTFQSFAAMANRIYADFEIWVSPAISVSGTVHTYTSRVVNSPAGSASATMTIDLEDSAWSMALLAVRGIDPDLPGRRAFGTLLFTHLFGDDVERVWRESRGRVDAGQADGLRVRLWIEAPELAVLPWELLCDPHDDGFLALSASNVLARYLPVPEPPLIGEHALLRVLLVVERPDGVPAIGDDEVQRLQKAISSVGPAVELITMDTPVVSEIQAGLQQEPHIVHFLGHGAPGKIILSGPGRTPQAVDEQLFATLFRGRRSVRLVVLAACASAQGNAAGLFAAVGPALVQARVPAVVAMQYPTVQLDTAATFSEMFYRRLASGLEVDLAVNDGRQSIAGAGLLDGRDWSTPVLYLGTRSGRLFNLAGVARPEIEKQWETVRAQVAEASQASAALDWLGEQLRELAGAHRRLMDVVELNRRMRELEAAYERVRRIADEAQGDGPSLRLADLKERWRELYDGRWSDLETFVAHHGDLDVSAWYPALGQGVARVEADVAREARRPLAENVVFALGKALARGSADVRDEQSRTLDAIGRQSERTLGRLPAV